MTAEVSDAIAKQVDTEIADFKAKGQKAVDDAVEQLNESGQLAYEKVTQDAGQFQKRVKLALVGFGALALAGVFGFVFESEKDVNQSVIDLQRDIIAAQPLVSDAEKSLTSATKDLNATQNEMTTESQQIKQTDAELDKAREELKTVTAQLDKARVDYQSMAALHKKPPER